MATEESRKRGPYRKTEERRKEIIAAALTVFSTSGYRTGSLKDIGALIGIDPSTILHHFSTKEALLEAVLEDKDSVDVQGLPPLDTLPAAEIPATLLALAAKNHRVPGVIALYAILSAESTTDGHPSTDYFRTRTANTRAEFRAAFQRLADEGLLAEGVSVEYAALSTFALWDGAQIHWLIEPEAVNVVDTLRTHLESITLVKLQ
ncbi:MAG: TetR/AcrR family transcriptional regulator [Rhodoglobus sp.]